MITATTRSEYLEKMKQKLDEWNREIDTLEGRVSTVTGSARETLRDQLKKTRKNYEAGRQKLNEIQAAGESSWEELRDEAEHVWQTLRHSINYFRSQL